MRCRYFGGPPRRTRFSLQVLYTAQPQDNYLDAAFAAVLQVHAEGGPGDVLVFLTGQEEIESLERLLSDEAAQLEAAAAKRDAAAAAAAAGKQGSGGAVGSAGEGGAAGGEGDGDEDGGDKVAGPAAPLKLLVCPIYAAMPPEQQLRVFAAAPAGYRKVILATNIAETSLTIPGVRHVIDSGFVKSRSYNARLGSDSLQVVPVSQAQARQRSGRAGREAPGACGPSAALRCAPEPPGRCLPACLRACMHARLPIWPTACLLGWRGLAITKTCNVGLR